MHKFHFVVNSKTKEKLLNYSKLRNLSLNETLKFILNKTRLISKITTILPRKKKINTQRLIGTDISIYI